MVVMLKLSRYFFGLMLKNWFWYSLKPRSKHFNPMFGRTGLDLATDSTEYFYYTSCSCRLDVQQYWLLTSYSHLGCHHNDSDFVCLRHRSKFSHQHLYFLIVKYFKPKYTLINTFSMVLTTSGEAHDLWAWGSLISQVSCARIPQFDELLLVCGKCH